jgi:hypothetical protein
MVTGRRVIRRITDELLRASQLKLQPRALTSPGRLESARGRRTDDTLQPTTISVITLLPSHTMTAFQQEGASCALDLLDLVIFILVGPIQRNDLRRPPADDEPSVDLTLSASSPASANVRGR